METGIGLLLLVHVPVTSAFAELASSKFNHKNQVASKFEGLVVVIEMAALNKKATSTRTAAVIKGMTLDVSQAKVASTILAARYSSNIDGAICRT